MNKTAKEFMVPKVRKEPDFKPCKFRPGTTIERAPEFTSGDGVRYVEVRIFDAFRIQLTFSMGTCKTFVMKCWNIPKPAAVSK